MSNFTSKLEKKHDVIMFNMSTMADWNRGVVNRNYNVLHKLAADERINRIVAVDFFPIGVKKAAKHYWQNIIKGPKTSDLVYGDLTSVCYQKSDKIWVYSSVDSFFSWKIVARELRRIEKVLDLKNIIFWSYNPFFTHYIGKLREEVLVFDTVDNWSEHSGYIKLSSKDELIANYKTIAESANVIFTVSDELREFYKKMKREEEVYWVPNGVDFDFFNDPKRLLMENELNQITKPIIGYLGTIQKDRVDLNLLVSIAKNNPDKVLALCGPIWNGIETELKAKLAPYNNVITTGRIPYDMAPSYINRFDVAIIPHQVGNFIKSTNPMKMYEYMACGKPIVSTRGAGVDMFPDLVKVANDYNAFNDLINHELKNDSEKWQKARRQAVKGHSWSSRVDFMLDKVFDPKLKTNPKQR